MPRNPQCSAHGLATLRRVVARACDFNEPVCPYIGRRMHVIPHVCAFCACARTLIPCMSISLFLRLARWCSLHLENPWRQCSKVKKSKWGKSKRPRALCSLAMSCKVSDDRTDYCSHHVSIGSTPLFLSRRAATAWRCRHLSNGLAMPCYRNLGPRCRSWHKPASDLWLSSFSCWSQDRRPAPPRHPWS